MRLRKYAKKLIFGSAPYFRGQFTYYGHAVHFPLGSEIFKFACEQGIYERETLYLIMSIVKPGTTYFDVGANIGLLSVPIVAERPGVQVVSIEASPTVLPFLNKTHAAARSPNWTVLETAVGEHSGFSEFWAGKAAMNAYDGLCDTGRGGPKKAVQVAVRTLDEIWQAEGCPTVGVVKIDIEGGEYSTIKGAKAMIKRVKPIFVLEWSELNLHANGVNPNTLLQLCAELAYIPHASPSLVRIDSEHILKMAMGQTETFLLVPST